MEVKIKRFNKKLIIYSLLFSCLILFLQNEFLADRDAYINWVNDVESIINSSHNLDGSNKFLFYLLGEPIFNYILFSIKWVFEKPEAVVTLINLTVGLLTAYAVMRNSESNSKLTFLYLINIFVLSSSLNHIRSGLSMCLILLTYDYPNFNKSFVSRIVRICAFFIHRGAIVFLLIDYLGFVIDIFNKIFGRYASFLLSIFTFFSSNLLFLIIKDYAPMAETVLGRGSFIGFGFYLVILILFLFANKSERNKNYVSILIISTYLSFYYTYPPVGRLLEMGYPFLIISVLNSSSSYKKTLNLLFLLGNISALIMNYRLLYVR